MPGFSRVLVASALILTCHEAALGKPTPKIEESASSFVRPLPDRRHQPSQPQRSRWALAGFAGIRDALATSTGSLQNFVTCGPGANLNTMTCSKLTQRHEGPSDPALSDEVHHPVPGSVTAAPLFLQDSWLVGTSEGFLVRIKSNKVGEPLQEREELELWGKTARSFIAGLKSASTGSETGSNSSLPKSWAWASFTGSRFTGRLVSNGSLVLGVTANNYLHAIQFQNGKTLWTSRLGRDLPLRLDTISLEIVEGGRQVVVGAPDGMLVGLNVENGQPLWQHRLSPSPTEHFPAVVAPPLVVERSLVVSSAEGETQKIQLESCASKTGCRVQWKLPVGSVTRPIAIANAVIVGGFNGSLVSAERESGAILWEVKSVFRADPIVAMASLTGANGSPLLVAASANGDMVLVDPHSGAILDRTAAVGTPIGEFFLGHASDEVCLSYAVPGFRCFRASLQHR